MKMDSRFVIDPRRNGNEGRFINHSCEPNCDLLKVNVMVEEEVERVASTYSKDDEDGEWGKKRTRKSTRSASKPKTETKVVSHVRLGVFSKYDLEANDELSFD